MSDFENFVNLELPKRPPMLTLANTGYDGDPNGGGAPVVVANSPQGTFFFRTTGLALYVKNSASPGTWELVAQSGASFSKVFVVLMPALADVAAVRAAYPANGANTFSGPFVNPDVPRNATVGYATGWDGGDVTVTGTDQFNVSISEVFPSAPGTVVTGAKIFKTVTGATKTTIGATTNTASIGVDSKLGIVGRLADTFNAMLFVDNIAQGATLDATYNGFIPATAPNGLVSYALLANVVQ